MTRKHSPRSRPALGSALLLIALLLSACAGKRLPIQDAHQPPPENPYGTGDGKTSATDSTDAETPIDFNEGDIPRAAPAESRRPHESALGSSAEALDAAPRTHRRDPFALRPSRPKARPGLGTQWGETRFSEVRSAPFSRANRLHPFSQSTIFYNDARGLSQLLRNGRNRRSRHRFSIARGHLDLTVRDGNHRALSGFHIDGRNYIRGRAGQRYTIVVRNHSPGRVEAVVSVDGLDVIDGREASFHKRGYLIEPFGELSIDGFRRSHRQVAAFRFGSVRGSYANQKHGSTRNVGVIGLAVFHERGDSPRFWPRGDDSFHHRHEADPFPGRFATP